MNTDYILFWVIGRHQGTGKERQYVINVKNRYIGHSDGAMEKEKVEKIRRMANSRTWGHSDILECSGRVST